MYWTLELAYRLEESLLLIVLLEEFLRESTLLGGKIQQLTVVTFANASGP